jgi:hypothetical protein
VAIRPGYEREGGEIRLEAEISKRTEDLAGLVNWGGKVRNKVPPGGDGGASYEDLPRLGVVR